MCRVNPWGLKIAANLCTFYSPSKKTYTNLVSSGYIFFRAMDLFHFILLVVTKRLGNHKLSVFYLEKIGKKYIFVPKIYVSSMKRRLIVSLLFLLLTFGVQIIARPYSLMLSDKQLSSSLINNVYQDRDGMIWVATENGLNRYDGTKVTTYCKEEGNPNSLTHNYVTFVYEDKAGNFYVGTYIGIQLYRRETDDFSEVGTFEDGASMQFSPSHVTETLDGKVYCTGSQLCEMKVVDGHIVLSDVKWNDVKGITGRIHTDRSGCLWTKHGDGSIMRIHPNGVEERPKINEMGTFTQVLSDAKSNVYLQSDKQDLYKYNQQNETWSQINRQYICSSTFKCIFRLDDYHILIGTDGSGIKMLNEATGEVSDYQIDLPNISSSHLKVHQIIKDKDGDLWLGLFLKGVSRIPMRQSTFYYLGSQSVASNLVGFSSISAICADRKGQMWVGTDGEGVFVVDDQQSSSKHIRSGNEGGQLPAIIQALYEDSEGMIWVGSYDGGCGRLNPQTLQYQDMTTLFRLGDNVATRVFAFKEDSEHRLWIATMGLGLFCYDLRARKVLPKYCFNLDINLWETTLLITTNNHLLIGTYDGVYDLDLNDAMPKPQQLFGRSIVFSLYEDEQFQLWAAGDAGLTRFSLEGDVFQVIDADKGLAGNVAYSVIGDLSRSLWIGTNRGLSCFNPSDSSFTNYIDGDGLQGNEFSKNVCCRDKEGRLWFGGANGINYFHPSQVRVLQRPLHVRLTAFYLNNKPVNASTLSGGKPIVSGPVHKAKEFTLLHEDNAFSVEISTTEFTNPWSVRYLYSINGSDWTLLPEGSHLVSFGAVRPGEYHLRFKAVQNHTESPVEEVVITIRPYWWESGWAKLGYALAALLLIAAFLYQVQRRYQAHRQMDLQKHAHEIDEAKLQFFTNITHEIRTPMTLIMSPLQKLISTDQNPARQQAYQTMQRNANMLLQLVNQLLDIRKIDNHQMRLQFRETEILGLMDGLIEFFGPIAENKRIQFEFKHLGLDRLNVWVDPGYFNKIIVNLLSNAFKYTPADGRVVLRVAVDSSRQDGKDEVLITVSDTGIGIAPEERELIFDRFYRASNAGLSADGNGVGLHLTRSLVTLHHGTIQVSENEEGKGSVFTVRLPLGNSHLSAEEMVVAPTDEPVKDEVPVSVIDPETTVKSNAPRTKYHLMVVDDDTEIRSYLCRELASDFHITECENGQQALQEMFRNKPDIVISDIMMPQVDGLTLCQRIKDNIGLNHIPVILLTAKADQESNLAGLDSGADAYITKPFYIEILRSTALNLVKSRSQLRNTYNGQQSQEDKLKEIDLPSPDSKLLERIMRSVNDNLSNPDYSVDVLCNDVGISRVHLYRKLKELTNQSPRDFIRNIRLKQAERLLLKEEAYSVNEIAEAVGFSRPNNFSAAFKELYGYPPLQWKAMKKEESSAEEL